MFLIRWFSAPESNSVRLIKELVNHPLFQQRRQAADLGYPSQLPLTVAELLIGNQWEQFFTTLSTDSGRTYVRSDPLIAKEVFDLCLVHRRAELHQIFPGAPLRQAEYDHDYCQLDQTLPNAYRRYSIVLQELSPIIQRRAQDCERGYTIEFLRNLRYMFSHHDGSARQAFAILEQFTTMQGLEMLNFKPQLRSILREKLIEFSHSELMSSQRLDHVWLRLFPQCVSQKESTFYFSAKSNVQAKHPSASEQTEATD